MKPLIQYPRLANHKRYAKNGDIPDVAFLRQLIDGQNHLMRYRRKTVFRAPCNMTSPFAGSAGTTNRWRFRFHSGYGAKRLRFSFGFGMDVSSASTDPRIDIDVTVAGGATTTRTIRSGAIVDLAKGVLTTPSTIDWRRPVVNISANTTYEVLVKAIDYCRPLGLVAFEEADTDTSVDYYHEFEPGSEQPVYDSIRQRILEGYSNMWRRNGSHLLNWTDVDDTGPGTFASTTWTNVVDGSTSVSASTPGFYLGDTGYRLDQWCRLSDQTALTCVFAVYGSMSASNTGEVRLQDASGTVVSSASLPVITTTPQWYAAAVTIQNCDTLGKVDLQARTSNAANTLTLNAVSLYTYLA
jgi:hypothetical protein